jgi:hypothetical protein
VDENLEDFSFSSSSSDSLLLCIDPTNHHYITTTTQKNIPPSSPSSSPSSCPLNNNSIAYQRSSPYTPVCIPKCDYDDTPPPCQKSKFSGDNTINHQPLGYQVMKCNDCNSEFCNYNKGDNNNTDNLLLNEADPCYQTCNQKDDESQFCHQLLQEEDEDDKSSLLLLRECLQECVAACKCSKNCMPVNQDAALCVEQGGRWHQEGNFDNVFQGMLLLFEISTTEGWISTLYTAIKHKVTFLMPPSSLFYTQSSILVYRHAIFTTLACGNAFLEAFT